MKIDGSCHCGEIAFAAELDLERVGICHCTDCQQLSASAFRTIAIVEGHSFKLLKGRPREYVKVGDSGNPRVQAFCQNCGSALYATDPGDNPKKYNIRVGTVRQRDQLVPKFECWHLSALPWVPKLGQTAKYDKNPS